MTLFGKPTVGYVKLPSWFANNKELGVTQEKAF